MRLSRSVLTGLIFIFACRTSHAATLVSKSSKQLAPARPSRALQTPPSPTPPAPVPKPAPTTNAPFVDSKAVGLVIGYVDYKEPGVMREYGPLYGVNASYSTLNDFNTIQWAAEGELVGGRLLYDGGSLDGTRYTRPTSDYILNLRGTVGAFSQTAGSWSTVFFGGVGLRDLNDKIDGTGSYNRNISYLYIPLGLQVAGAVNENWSLLFSADLDLMIYGTVISKLSDVDSSYPDLTNHNRGTGARATLVLRRTFGGTTLRAGLFYQKWKIDESDQVKITLIENGVQKTGYLAEPQNESDFAGLNLGVEF